MHVSCQATCSFSVDALQFAIVVTLFYQSLDWTKISGATQPIINNGVSLLASDSDKQFMFLQRSRIMPCTVGVLSQTWTLYEILLHYLFYSKLKHWGSKSLNLSLRIWFDHSLVTNHRDVSSFFSNVQRRLWNDAFKVEFTVCVNVGSNHS